MQEKQKYSKAIKELEEIVTTIESGEMDLDEITKQMKKAVELIRFCKEKLKTTEVEVEKFLQEIK